MQNRPINSRRISNTLIWCVLGGMPLLHCSPASAATFAPVERKTLTSGKYYTVNSLKFSDGSVLKETFIKGPPAPPAGFVAQRQAISLPTADSAAGTNSLTDVPAFNWVFGCSAVSGAMIAGYYDRNGFPNIYTGPTNGGVMPLTNASWPTWSNGSQTYPNCPLIASKNDVDGRTSKGTIDDYWVNYDSSTSDPYITGGWTQHTWGDAIGDYMKTSQSAYDNTDGSTSFYTWNTSASPLTCSDMETYNIQTRDGTYGRKLFYEARGYAVTDCYSQKTDNTISGGFSFAQFKAEIDAGNPVLLNLAGHSIVGVGYDDSTNTVYLHDTWDYSDHTMTWGGSYANMALQSVSIVHIAPPTHQLTATIGGNKRGTVAVDTGTLKWSGNTCTGSYSVGTTVAITGTAAIGSVLKEWDGCDSVSDNVCTVTLSADKAVTAVFSPPQKIKVSPMSVNFGSLKADTKSSPRTVTITNIAATGAPDLTLLSYELSGTNPSEFGLDTSFCPSTLSRGASCPVYITATPSSGSFAPISAVLNINSNDPKKGTVSVKLAAIVSPPVLSVSPSSVNFGKIAAGSTSATKTITIRNAGISDLSISSVTLGGTSPSQFTQTNSCSTLVKGNTCGITVSFTPASAGAQSATLTIASNAPTNNGTVTVKLSGTGY